MDDEAGPVRPPGDGQRGCNHSVRATRRYEGGLGSIAFAHVGECRCSHPATSYFWVEWPPDFRSGSGVANIPLAGATRSRY